jgi:hypothetical protein
MFICIIKQIYESYNLKFNINYLISGFINLVEINNLEPMPIYKNILNDGQILNMYNAFKNNIAPIKL